MGDDERSNRRVGQIGGHRQLDHRKKFTDPCAEGREAENAIVLGDQALDEAAGLGECARTEVGEHGDLGKTISDSPLFRLVFAQANVRQFRIDEGAEGNLPPLGAAIGAREVVADGAKVVEGDMSEVGGTGAVSHRPDARGGRLEAIIDLDVTRRSGFNADNLQAHVSGIGSAA